MSDALLFFVCLAAVLCIRQFIGCAAVVKGRSMLSTLHPRDVMLAVRPPLLYRHIRRGDIVLCRYPGRYWRNLRFVPQTFVKRVVGLPGETIEIADGVVLIDGEPLSEPYLDPAHCRFRRSMPPRTLSADEYFVMATTAIIPTTAEASAPSCVPPFAPASSRCCSVCPRASGKSGAEWDKNAHIVTKCALCAPEKYGIMNPNEYFQRRLVISDAETVSDAALLAPAGAADGSPRAGG
ncbi:MAG: signal peptidase I [Christensenellales bacterium]